MRTAMIAAMLGGCVPHLTSPADTDTDDESWACADVTNTWPTVTPPEGLAPQGFGLGQVVPDFRMPDQHGDDVCLWQFYGRPVVLDVSTMWCSPCQALARETQHTVDDYADKDLVYVTVLAEDLESEPPATEDLQAWATQWEIDGAPIVADDAEKTYANQVVVGAAFPALLVLGTNLQVVADLTSSPTDAKLREALDAL
jgi:thiol-disulfide isomerase/thioredoxin